MEATTAVYYVGCGGKWINSEGQRRIPRGGETWAEFSQVRKWGKGRDNSRVKPEKHSTLCWFLVATAKGVGTWEREKERLRGPQRWALEKCTKRGRWAFF